VVIIVLLEMGCFLLLPSHFCFPRYCLDVLPKTFHDYVTWFCVDCEPKVGKKLSTIDKATFLPSAISHPINSKNVQATQSRIGLKKKICSQRLKNSKKVKKKKIKVTTDSLAKATMEICENRPSLQLNETHCGKICEKDQKLGQDLRLVLTDDTNSNDEVGYLNHSLQLCEMHCGENCEGQKLGQEAGVDLKDGANLEEVAESVTPSLRCSEMLNDENCEKLQKLRLDLKDKTNADVEAESVKTSHIAMRDPSNILEHKCHVRSQPIIDRIWRYSIPPEFIVKFILARDAAGCKLVCCIFLLTGEVYPSAINVLALLAL
jgi:hypothetical protein